MNINPLKIKELLNRRPSDLLALFDEHPRYCKEELVAKPKNRDETMIMGMARQHVWFIDQYGDVGSVQDGDRLYSQNIQRFEEWVELGCPGINKESFERYFKLKPL